MFDLTGVAIGGASVVALGGFINNGIRKSPNR